ncbi:hypothetical protein GGH92_010090 [Coemansia sp. RSA 2673]|nr:hypothetical protein GGH92_010090 [Coemansia sp. RSA 2673]
MLLLVGSGRALGTVWRLSTGARLVVGRKDAPLLIEGDRSVSRVHATVVTLADDMSGVDIEDEGSKFGIHINGHSCPGRATSRLNIGDTIMFGAQDSTFELRRSPISLCIANMRSEPPSAVHAILANAGSLGKEVACHTKVTHAWRPTLMSESPKCIMPDAAVLVM